MDTKKAFNTIVVSVSTTSYLNNKASWEVIRGLVEKSIPKTADRKEIRKIKEHRWICPQCGDTGINKTFNYCSNCGQKLNWKD